jgi:hypothetical protein
VAGLNAVATERCREQFHNGSNDCSNFATPQQIAKACGPAPNCAPVSGVLRPKFVVATVVYAPPGTANKGASSSVDYGSGSTAGTNESQSTSFKQDYSETLSTTLGDPKTASLQFDITSTQSSTSGSSNSIDLKKSANADFKVFGPSTDGVNHDFDQIWLLLSPVVNVQGVGSNVTWSLWTHRR